MLPRKQRSSASGSSFVYLSLMMERDAPATTDAEEPTVATSTESLNVSHQHLAKNPTTATVVPRLTEQLFLPAVVYRRRSTSGRRRRNGHPEPNGSGYFFPAQHQLPCSLPARFHKKTPDFWTIPVISYQFLTLDQCR